MILLQARPYLFSRIQSHRPLNTRDYVEYSNEIPNRDYRFYYVFIRAEQNHPKTDLNQQTNRNRAEPTLFGSVFGFVQLFRFYSVHILPLFGFQVGPGLTRCSALVFIHDGGIA